MRERHRSYQQDLTSHKTWANKTMCGPEIELKGGKIKSKMLLLHQQHSNENKTSKKERNKQIKYSKRHFNSLVLNYGHFSDIPLIFLESEI